MSSKHQKTPNVVIIGAGISGIMLGIELKKRFGLETFTIYERFDEPGGTWRDNFYPGCACDIPSHWYSLSTELNPDWTSKYSPQSEIKQYWQKIFNKYNLASHTVYGATFKRAEYISDKHGYNVEFTRKDGSVITVFADVLVSAIGGFSTPSEHPEGMKGLEDFKGPVFHSARWNPNVELKGKRVGVIGNGCSAAQFVPEIAKDHSTKVINFSRTPSWFLERDQRKYTSVEKAAFKYVPGVGRLYRWYLATTLDWRYPMWLESMIGVRSMAEEWAIHHITSTAPAKYHEFLIPKYPMGCKRIIMDPGYLKSLNQSNVELVTDPIETITEKGIKGKSGEEYEFDVLILGTGFVVTSDTLGLDVVGANGVSMMDQWKKQDGPQAYKGTAVHNFPNLYMILGPNVATGHASVIAGTECQVNFIMNMIEPMVKYGVKSLEVKSDAEDNYNTKIHSKLSHTVWNGSCASYYKLGKKLIVPFPGTMMEYWWTTKNIDWDHFRQIGGTRRLALWRRIKQVIWAVALLSLAIYLQRTDLEELRNNALIFTMNRVIEVRRLRKKLLG